MRRFIIALIFSTCFGELFSQPSQRLYVNIQSFNLEDQINYPKTFGDVFDVNIYDSTKIEGWSFRTRFAIKDNKILSSSFFDRNNIKTSFILYYGSDYGLERLKLFNISDNEASLDRRFEFKNINKDSFIIQEYITIVDESLFSITTVKINKTNSTIKTIRTQYDEDKPVGTPTIKLYTFRGNNITSIFWDGKSNEKLTNKSNYEYNDNGLVNSITYYSGNKFIEKNNFVYTYDEFNNWTKLEVYNSLDNLVKTVYRKVTYTKDAPVNTLKPENK